MRRDALAAVVGVAVAAAGACKKREQPIEKKPPVPLSAEVIALPTGSGEPIGTATTLMRYQDGAFVEITVDSVIGDRTRPFHGIDGEGNLHAGTPDGFVTAGVHDARANTAPTAVFVDRTVTAAALRPAVPALRDRCWGFAVNDHGKLEVLLPEPCPPPARPLDRANLDVYVTADGRAGAGITQPPSTAALADLDALAAFLAEQHTKSDYLTGRTDVDIAVDGETTVGQLTLLLVRAHAAGFKAAAWVAKVPDAVVALTR